MKRLITFLALIFKAILNTLVGLVYKYQPQYASRFSVLYKLLGHLYVYNKDYAQALSMYTEAYNLADKVDKQQELNFLKKMINLEMNKFNYSSDIPFLHTIENTPDLLTSKLYKFIKAITALSSCQSRCLLLEMKEWSPQFSFHKALYHYELAKAYFQTEYYNLAISHYNKYLETKPYYNSLRYINIYQDLAVSYKKLNDYETALEFSEAARTIAIKEYIRTFIVELNTLSLNILSKKDTMYNELDS